MITCIITCISPFLYCKPKITRWIIFYALYEWTDVRYEMSHIVLTLWFIWERWIHKRLFLLPTLLSHTAIKNNYQHGKKKLSHFPLVNLASNLSPFYGTMIESKHASSWLVSASRVHASAVTNTRTRALRSQASRPCSFVRPFPTIPIPGSIRVSPGRTDVNLQGKKQL